MNKRVAFFFTLLAALGLAASVRAQQAQPAPAEKPRRAVVTLDGKLEALPRLAPEDFEIEAGKQKGPATRVYGPSDLPTVLAIVLQENQTSAFGTQLPALRDFILHQPANTYVGLFYLSQQAVDTAVMFDSNLEKVAAALRAPKGVQDAAPPCPYNNLMNLINYMAGLPDARKEVLVFTEGSDALAGDATPGQNQNLVRAVMASQQAGIPVWVIYSEALPPTSRAPSDTSPLSGKIPGRSGATGSGGMTAAQQSSGAQGRTIGAGGSDPFSSGSDYAPHVQYNVSYLNYLTDHVGGKVFSAGKFPPDIRPFLDEFQRLLAQQYVVEFSGSDPVKKVKVNRKIGGAKLLAPKQ